MNISTISTNQIAQLTSTAATPAVDTTQSVSSASADAMHSQMSGPGQLMSKLTQLKQTDPAKFKEVVSSMASSLKEAASQQTGRAADMLNSLATKLSDVANGGDISQLKPSGPPPGGAGGPHGHHGHHHGGGGAPPAGSSDSADAAQKYDANAAASQHDSVKQTLDSVFGQLDAALSSTAA